MMMYETETKLYVIEKKMTQTLTSVKSLGQRTIRKVTENDPSATHQGHTAKGVW